MAAILTPDDHAQFIADGYVVLRGVVAPEILAAANARLGDNSECLHHDSSDAVRACLSDAIGQAIGELFGAAYPFDYHRGGSDMARPYQPDAAWPEPVAHVDDNYPLLMPNSWAVGSFVFLTDVASHGGAFIYFSGSPRRYRLLLARDPHALKYHARDRELSGDYTEFLAKAGDALLFHHCMGHSGSPNVSTAYTRHALLSRWHPRQRIVPGLKAFAEMTTIEKANSARYLTATFGTDFDFPHAPSGPTPDRILREGWAPTTATRAYAVIYRQGAAHLYSVAAERPQTVQHHVAKDCVGWQAQADLPLPITAPIDSLSVHLRGNDLYLSVGLTAGGARLLRRDPATETWTVAGERTNCRCPQLQFVGKTYGSRIAWGQLMLHYLDDTGREIRCAWDGEDPSRFGNWDHDLAVAEAADDVLTDLQLAPIRGESVFGMICDSTAHGVPLYLRTKEIAKPEESFAALPFTAPSAPRRLRVFYRALEYWLVTYLRDTDHGPRLFWGAIDWQDGADLKLREITTSAALQQAFCICGLI